MPLDRIEPSAGAIRPATETGKDPRLMQLILDQCTEVVRKAPGVLITLNRLGLVCANAGIDQFNLDHGRSATACRSRRRRTPPSRGCKHAISPRIGRRIGVMISDRSNRPLRLGTVGNRSTAPTPSPLPRC